MKRIGLAFLCAILIFLFALAIAPMIPSTGSYNVDSFRVINAILFSLIFIVIICTMLILDKFAEVKEKLDGFKK